jgi:hypothetical protein
MGTKTIRHHTGTIVKHYKGGTVYMEGRWFFANNCLGEFLGYQPTMLEALQDLDEDEKERNTEDIIL